MDHPFAHRAHYNAQGKPCHCPWGYSEDSEHLGSVKESSKLDWLQSRPDLQNHEGWDWLDHIQGAGSYAEKADKLLPWLTREWKKKRIYPDIYSGHLNYEDPQSGLAQGISPDDVAKIQSSLEEMKKRGQGIDVMQHKVHELLPKVQDFKDWKDSQGRKDMGKVIHRFDDGWTVRQLNTPEEMVDEGNKMGHCLNDPSYGYHSQAEDGDRIYASLRDHKNMPHATMEITPDHWRRGEEIGENQGMGAPGYRAEGWEAQLGPEATIDQFYGKEDAPPLPKYQQRMHEWLQPHGVPFEWEDNPEAELWREQQQGIVPAMASVTRSLYYRWIYSPSNGVTLGSNQDDHPALVKYHSELGGDINDTDLVHGYASALDGGWRITDLEHQPVEDPYIVQQVVRRLNHEDGPQIRSEGSWQPSEYDWERLHYAMPCEEVVI